MAEDGGMIHFEVGVMEGYLEVEVNIIFTTVQLTAQGMNGL